MEIKKPSVGEECQIYKQAETIPALVALYTTMRVITTRRLERARTERVDAKVLVTPKKKNSPTINGMSGAPTCQAFKEKKKKLNRGGDRTLYSPEQSTAKERVAYGFQTVEKWGTRSKFMIDTTKTRLIDGGGEPNQPRTSTST